MNDCQIEVAYTKRTLHMRLVLLYQRQLNNASNINFDVSGL